MAIKFIFILLTVILIIYKAAPSLLNFLNNKIAELNKKKAEIERRITENNRLIKIWLELYEKLDKIAAYHKTLPRYRNYKK